MNSFLLGDKGTPKQPAKVLIVDSDPQSVQALGAALRKEGYEPLEATTFEAAKKLWLEERPPILIADVRLGQFNGLQLLLRAKSDRPDVAGIITSAVADNVLAAETERFGGKFFVKPLNPRELLAATLALQPAAEVDRTVERRIGERRTNLVRDPLPDRRLVDRRRFTNK